MADTFSSQSPLFTPPSQSSITHRIYSPQADSQTSPSHNSAFSRPRDQNITQQDTPQQDIPAISRDTTPIAHIKKPGTPPNNVSAHPSSPISLATSHSDDNSSITLSPPTTMTTCTSHGGTFLDPIIDIYDSSSRSTQKETCEDITCTPPTDKTPTQELPPTAPESTPPTSSQSVPDGDLRTPNVYINGLPPDFPEDQLLAMTQEFGEVLSVRTFTRHVSEKPSGYGFVLFGSVTAAERCIEALRKYRSLHPSFSKQIHKIPGTAYASSQVQVPSLSENPDSFKARMERLKDHSSTNLYMEGLPVSIDEPTLAALVSPYKIMSSRFFQTRLSTPPRIIAFVRLETREAAEEIIERLHGRMVRGWRDAGSRISVRFADTGEQRELRRTERTHHEGDSSPAKLTMAHAALLSMKGNQLPDAQTQRSYPLGQFLPPSLGPELPFTTNDVMQHSLPPPIGLHHQQETRYVTNGLDTPSISPSPSLNAQAAEFPGVGLRLPAQSAELGSVDGMHPEVLRQLLARGGLSPAPGAPTRADHGFTPTEQLILQAHAQRQRATAQHRDHAPAYTEFNVAAPEFNPSSATLGKLGFAARRHEKGNRLVNILPSMTEEDFHATGGGYNQVVDGMTRIGATVPTCLSDHDLGQLSLDLQARLAFSRQRNQTCSSDPRLLADLQAPFHNRSTSVPSHYNSADTKNTLPMNLSNVRNIAHPSVDGGYAPSSVNRIRNPSCLVKGQANNHYTQQAPKYQGSGQVYNYASIANGVSPNSFNSHHPHSKPDGRSGKFLPSERNNTRINTGLRKAQEPLFRYGSHDADDEDEGSSQDLPALSYMTRTPASLSPPTPASAFGESFDAPQVNVANPTVIGGQVGLGVDVGKGTIVGGHSKAKMPVDC